MNVRDRVSGLFCLAISIFVCIQAVQIDIGTFHLPGPGFVPFWSGVIFGTFSIILVVSSFLRKSGQKKPEKFWKDRNWRKVIFVLISLFVYGIVLQKLGYLLATFGLLVFLFGLMGKSKWWVRLAAAAITSSATYAVFYIWLEVQLPGGILGR
jgi:putative tricarboxylic transport membrane protein